VKMQRLIEKSTVPPDGFRYFQPETRTTVRAPDYDNLFVEVAKHRKVNNIPLGALWQGEVENQLCEQLPPGFCKQEDPFKDRRNVFTRVGWDDVLHGTQSVVSWAVHGGQYVEQALADSRAAICAGCYYNVQIGGLCGACTALQNLVAKTTSGRHTSSDAFLKACAVCKCANAVQVHMRTEDLAKGVPEAMLSQFPGFCWKRAEIEMIRGIP
jgi:hypothetical protein